MNITFFKASPSGKGAMVQLFTIKDTKKEDQTNLMLSLAPQISWDASKRIGRFAKESSKKTFSKLEVIEIGGIIRSLENHENWSAYHKTAAGGSQIILTPRENKVKYIQGSFPSLDFTLQVNSGNNKVASGINQNEARVLCEFLKKALFEVID